jgi:hypothetical protein
VCDIRRQQLVGRAITFVAALTSAMGSFASGFGRLPLQPCPLFPESGGPGSSLEIDIGERLSAMVAHDKAGVLFLDRPRRREAACRQVTKAIIKTATMIRITKAIA